jgi:cytoskeletal protein RodZ
LEANAFDEVPGGLFTRGYLRAYAAQVGLDPEAIVDAYRAEFAPPVAVTAEPNAEPPEPALVRWDSEAQDTSSRHSEILQFSVVMIVALVYLASLRHAKPTADLALAQTVAASAPAPAAPAAAPTDAQPVGTSGSMPTAQHARAIEIHPSGPCWVDVTVGGAHPISRLMNAGDRETVTVQEEITLRVGDPAAFAFTIDGAAGRALGPEGHAVTVHINPSNYRTFLAAAHGG